MAEVSKEVANWMAIVRTVTASMQQHGDEVGGKLDLLYFPGGVPEGASSARMLKAAADLLLRRASTLREADLALSVERADDKGTVGAKRAAVTSTRGKVIRVRSLLEGAFPAEVVRELGLTGQTPSDPDELAQYASVAAEAIASADLPRALRRYPGGRRSDRGAPSRRRGGGSRRRQGGGHRRARESSRIERA